MSLIMQVSVNNIDIERITATRREPFNGDEKIYTYDVRYHRQQEHRTAPLMDAHVVVRHRFRDGSLALIAKSIAALSAGESET